MSYVIFKSLRKVSISAAARDLWGKRLLQQYLVEIEFQNNCKTFTWAIAEFNCGNNVIPDYGEDFNKFLVDICEEKSFRRCKRFVHLVQETISLAIHHDYAGTSSEYTDLPITLDSKCI